MDIIEFKVEHLDKLLPQLAQKADCAVMTPQYRRALDSIGIAVTVVDGDEIIACGGFLHYFPHRAEMWSILGEHANKHMVTLTRIGRRMLDGCSYRRVEATVASNFMEGHRWLNMLGFEIEREKIPFFGPNQETTDIYVRLR